jgi:hypothetical protein
MMARKGEIAAAIGAYNATGRMPLPAAEATRLLTVMFADTDLCQRNLDSLAAEGFSRSKLVQLLRDLIEGGLVSKERGVSRAPNTCYDNFKICEAIHRLSF